MSIIVIRTSCEGCPTKPGEFPDLGDRVGEKLSIREELTGESATLETLRLALIRHRDCKFIVFFGHGTPDRLLAHNHDIYSEDAVIQRRASEVHPPEIAGRNVYAFACLAGRDLGPALISIGSSFIGYNEEIWSVPLVPEFDEDVRRIVYKGLDMWVGGETRESVVDYLRSAYASLCRSYSYGGPKSKIRVDARNLASAAARVFRDSVC